MVLDYQLMVYNKLMLEGIFGNQTVEKILLSLYHYSEIHAQAIADDHKTALNPIRKQLDRLESSGVILSRPSGRMRLYSFNPKSPYMKPVKEIIGILYEGIPLKEREELFFSIRKPRRKGKPFV